MRPVLAALVLSLGIGASSGPAAADVVGPTGARPSAAGACASPIFAAGACASTTFAARPSAVKRRAERSYEDRIDLIAYLRSL
jgi:hypothetical protein